MALIVLNAVILGVLTYAPILSPGLVRALEGIDACITAVFVVEICLKVIACRMSFFRSGWNWFDLIVVALAVIPSAGSFTVLRSLRVLRVLRLLRVVPMLRRITEALLKALPGMGAIFAVLGLVTYVAAVMATNMYGRTDNEEVAAMFGDLPSSTFTLFQVMTLDGWRNEVVQKVMNDGHPEAWAFFLVFIFLASFVVLNLFIALIVEALQANHEALQEQQIGKLEEEAEEAQEERDEIKRLLLDLRSELDALRRDRGGGRN